MATPPITIPISATDLTSPAFQSATRSAQQFQQAVERQSYSMREARGSAMLLSEEIGIKLNRHLAGVLANSQLIGGVLATAFSGVAAVGFFEVAVTGGQKLLDLLNDTAFKAAHFEKMSTIHKEFQKATEEAKKLNREIELAQAANPAARSALEFKFKTEDAKAAKKPVDDLADAMTRAQEKLKSFQDAREDVLGATGFENFDPVAAREIDRTTARLETLFEELTVAVQKEMSAEAQAGAAGKKAFKDRSEELAKYQKLFKEFMAAQEKWVAEYKVPDLTKGAGRFSAMRLENIPGVTDQQIGPAFYGSMLMPDAKVADDARKRFEQLGEVWKETRTPLERYRIEVANLNDLFDTGALRSTDLYKRALEELNDKYKQGHRYLEEFGKATGQIAEQAALFGRSWKDAIQAILIDVAKLIIQMTILKDLEKQYGKGGEKGGLGGFATAFLGGFAGGFASGGYIPPGQWGWTGEDGPEPIYGGKAGVSVLPGSSNQTIINVDARGDLAQEQRIMRAIRVAHDSAVQTSLKASRERGLRGMS